MPPTLTNPATSQLFLQNRAFEERVAKREAETQLRLASTYRTIITDLSTDITALENKIAARIASGQDVPVSWLHTDDRYKTLILKANDQFNKFADATTAVLGPAQKDVIRLAERSATAMIEAQLPNAQSIVGAFHALPTQAIQQLTGSLEHGPLPELLNSFGPDAARAISDELTTGLAKGLHPSQITRNILNKTDLIASRAAVISRTELYRSFREANRASFNANDSVVSTWIWCAHLGPGTCAACLAMNGQEFHLKEPMPSHPNCRCTCVPKTKSWAELGLPGVPETRVEPFDFGDGEDWLAGQDHLTQLRAFRSKSLHEGWVNGDYRLDDVVVRRSSPAWGDSVSVGGVDHARAQAALHPERAPRVNEFFARPGSGDIELSAETVAEMRGGSAAEHILYNPITKTYRWDQETQAVHDEIVRGFLQDVPESDTPTIHMLGGGPAAGKSSMVRSGGLPIPDTKLREAVLVNPDEIKELMPAYAGWQGEQSGRAAFAHEESSYLAKRVQKAAVETRRNVLLDGVGTNYDKTLRIARPAGYKVKGYYAFVDPEEAVARATARGIKTGRFVPESYIRSKHAEVAKIFEDAAGKLDEITLFNTNDGVQMVARKVAGGQLEILDDAAYDYFQGIATGRSVGPIPSSRFVESTAKSVVERAASAEVETTRDIVDVGKIVRGDPNGSFTLDGKTFHTLDARLKSEASTARKIAGDMKEKGLSLAEAEANVYDSLRYTYLFDPADYGVGVRRATEEMNARGYKLIRRKNFWELNEDGYAGINDVWESPTGQRFELQYHTQKTIDTKEVISHPLYEKMRVLESGDDAFIELQAEINRAWRAVRNDAPDLDGLVARAAPKEWTPMMTRSEADLWSSGGKLNRPLFHTTEESRARNIEKTGFDLNRKKAWGRNWGDGAYMTDDLRAMEFYSEAFSDPTQLELRVRADKVLRVELTPSNPYSFGYQNVFEAAAKDTGKTVDQIKSLYWQKKSEVETAQLHLKSKYEKLYSRGTNEFFDALEADPEYIAGDTDVVAFTRVIRDDLGYDAIDLYEESFTGTVGGSQVVVFDPKRIVVIQPGT